MDKRPVSQALKYKITHHRQDSHNKNDSPQEMKTKYMQLYNHVKKSL